VAALERGRLGAQREPNPHSASGSLGILGHEADGHALIEHRGGTLGQAEMQLADGGGVPSCDLDERTTSDHKVTAPRVGDGDWMEALGDHVLLERPERAAVATWGLVGATPTLVTSDLARRRVGADDLAQGG
jgi:hypothetical protein